PARAGTRRTKQSSSPRGMEKSRRVAPFRSRSGMGRADGAPTRETHPAPAPQGPSTFFTIPIRSTGFLCAVFFPYLYTGPTFTRMLDPRQQVLILASSSQRRQALLREAGIAFEACPPHVPEQRAVGEGALEYALRLAQEKAQAVAQQFPHRYILGADTIVLVDQEVLEKPRDTEDAARMLRLLSGRGHSVTTAVSLVGPEGRLETRCATTQVHFRKIQEQEISEYIAGGEPMDKAG